MLFRKFTIDLQKIVWQWYFDFLLFLPAWYMLSQRTLWSSSTRSSFIVVMIATEESKVDTCLIDNKWMNEWIAKERVNKHLALCLAFPINTICYLWMNASLILIYKGYCCLFMLSSVLISPKLKQESWSHKLGLWHHFHSWALVSPFLKQRAC